MHSLICIFKKGNAVSSLTSVQTFFWEGKFFKVLEKKKSLEAFYVTMTKKQPSLPNVQPTTSYPKPQSLPLKTQPLAFVNLKGFY